ncbi:DUF2236 domain-containing protein [Parvularcula marina]|uniref:DUF2236 domain-containing protein n=1 Tax=Parvularcula marina TaxID=2292771 RepID=A0A371R816_9PROT|nr:DUF2236 domain-containing protein [Parvularcula marina]
MGEAALVPPDSVSWRIFRNPISLFIGGVTAVILELAEPRVRHGVWTFSDFRRDPKARLQRTGLAAMVTVYAAKSVAAGMIERIVRRHDAVEGIAEDGRAYRANDTELLDWVQATAMFGFVEAYSQFVRPLPEQEKDAAYLEATPAGDLYGATGTPRTNEAMTACIDAWEEQLSSSPVIDEFLSLMQKSPLLPWPAKPLQKVLIRAAIGLVPQSVRERLGLDGDELSPRELRLVRLTARTVEKLTVKGSPPVEACLRLGLPEDYLTPRR